MTDQQIGAYTVNIPETPYLLIVPEDVQSIPAQPANCLGIIATARPDLVVIKDAQILIPNDEPSATQ